MEAKRLTFLLKIAWSVSNRIRIWTQVCANPEAVQSTLLHKTFQVLELKWRIEEGFRKIPPTHNSESKAEEGTEWPLPLFRKTHNNTDAFTAHVSIKNLSWQSFSLHHIEISSLHLFVYKPQDRPDPC